jgi:ribosomal protein S6
MSKEHEDKEKKTQAYELGYHLVPSLSEDDLALRVTDLQKAVTAEGGSVISEGQPQAFTLAYPMRKMRGGRWDHYDSTFFGWVRFEVSPDALEVIKDFLDHNEYLVRYLLIKLDDVALASKPVSNAKIEMKEVETEPKELVKKQEKEEKGEVVEEELDKEIEELIK